MTEPHRPCRHLTIQEDGHRLEKSPDGRGGVRRTVWILSTCDTCNQRFEELWDMRRRSERRPIRTVDQSRESA